MKTIASKKSYWKYLLLWLGVALTIAGLSAAAVSGNWGPLPLGLLISGIVLCGLWLLFQARATNWWSRRSTQAGTNALIATLSVLVILGLINFLGTRYSTRVDMTETRLYTLAPESRELVQNLSEPVKVWVFDRDRNPENRELLENYRRQGQEFSFEYVDPQAQPGLAQKFGVKNFGEVYVEAGKQRRLVQTLNQGEPLAETRLTNAIQQVTSDRTASVYFLQGHGEESIPTGQDGAVGQGALSQAISALANKNYTIEPLNLAQQPSIPKDASVVVVAGPKRELFDREVKALRDYLNQGGSLLLMIDPNTSPGFSNLLENWGVALSDRLIIDPSGASSGLGPTIPIVTNYGDHPITKDFSNGISIYKEARPIGTTEARNVQATPILITSPQSWAESDLSSEELEFNPNSDQQGPLILGVALSRPVETQSNSTQSEAKPSPSPESSPQPPTNSPTPAEESEKKQGESRLVVIGDSDFATNGLFDQQLNGDVFLNSVSWLSKQDKQLLSIRPREAKSRRINLTPQQASILSWSSLIIVPLIGFGMAVILWWRRR